MLDTRRSRLVAASCLALSAIVAGFVAWTAEQRRVALLGRERVAEERLDQLVELVAELDARASAIAATASSAEPAIAAFEDTMARSDRVAAALRRDALADTIGALQEFEQASRALEQAVAGATRTTETPPAVPSDAPEAETAGAPSTGAAHAPAPGDPAVPLDTITSGPLGSTIPDPPPAAPHAAGLPGLGPEARRVRLAHRMAFERARADLADREWSAAAIAGAIWSLGLLALVWLPRVRTTVADSTAPAAPGAAAEDAAPVHVVAPVAADRADADLRGTLRACRDIARLGSLDELPGVLSLAAEPLGASGLMVWAADGPRLVPWISHGYAPGITQRIAAIDLADTIHRNPVTDAWRSGEPVAVPSSPSGPGALAIPIVGPGGCTGILALELRAGADSGPLAMAKASFVAAQLGAILSPGPALPDVPPSTDAGGDAPHAIAT